MRVNFPFTETDNRPRCCENWPHQRLWEILRDDVFFFCFSFFFFIIRQSSNLFHRTVICPIKSRMRRVWRMCLYLLSFFPLLFWYGSPDTARQTLLSTCVDHRRYVRYHSSIFFCLRKFFKRRVQRTYHYFNCSTMLKIFAQENCYRA